MKNELCPKQALIMFFIAVIILSLTSCIFNNEPPNKRATVIVTTIMGQKDTLSLEYYQSLRIDDQHRLVDENSNSVKARYVVNFSIIGSVTNLTK